MLAFLLYALLYFAIFCFGALAVWYATEKSCLISCDNTRRERANDHVNSCCRVCGKEDCQRDTSSSGVSLPPYINTNFLVDEPISEAFFEFFEIIIDRYIATWHREISDNDEFLCEIRCQIKYSVSALLHRIAKCNLAVFVDDHVIPAAVSHYQVCQGVVSKGNLGSASSLESLVLRGMKPHLHVAMKDRNAEYEYLKSLVATILPYLLHPAAKGSRSLELLVTEILTVSVLMPALDALASPHTLNRLILLAFDDSPVPQAVGERPPKVPVLHRYAELWRLKYEADHPVGSADAVSSITKVYEHHGLRQAFIEYMKFCRSLDLIVFFGDLEMINRDLLAADIKEGTCQRMYKDIERLYDNLLHNNQEILQTLQLNDEFMSCLRNVIKEGHRAVPSLRTTSAWFNAHERACNFLEAQYLPGFVSSDFYLKAVVLEKISADDANADQQKMTSQQSEAAGNVTCNSDKSTDADQLVSQSVMDVVDGVLMGEAAIDAEYPEVAALANQLTGFGKRSSDMATWRVSVTGLGDNCSDDSGLSSGVMKYIINVTHADTDDSWKVYRKYSEFYVLEEKLRDFHGQALSDLSLQSKRLIGSSNREFLNGKRAELEAFLRALLAKPLLRQSQLLRLFLTNQVQEFETSLLPDLSLNRLTSKFQSRGLPLAKDFLPSLLASTQSPPPQPTLIQRDGRASGPESLKQSRLHNFMFWNNAALPADESPKLSAACPIPTARVTGVYDVIMFFVERVLTDEQPNMARQWLCHLLLGLRPLARPLIDKLVRNLINNKINELTQHHRAVPIIHLLRDLAFHPELHPSQDADKHKCRAEALSSLKRLCSSVGLSQLLGRECVEPGLSRVFDFVQYPRVNKQLAFTMLDPLVLQLFPELHMQ